MIFVRRSSVGLALGFDNVVNVRDLSAVISSSIRLIEDAELWILQENLQITFGSICGGVNVALDELEKSSSRFYEIISGDDEFLLWRVNTMKATQAPCSSCVRQTIHDVLFEIEQRDVDQMEIIDGYELLRCRGCSTISMAHHGRCGESVEHNYYPSPVSRKEPDWVLWLVLGDKKELKLGGLLGEIYQAVYGGQYRLASMGIRALLEQVMILKVDDLYQLSETLTLPSSNGTVIEHKIII